MSDIKLKIIFGMLFLKLNNTDKLFKKKHLYQHFIASIKLYPSPKYVQIINKIIFIIAALNADSQICIIYINI